MTWIARDVDALLEIPPLLDRRRHAGALEQSRSGDNVADDTYRGGSEQGMARAKKQNEEDQPLEKRLKGYLVTTVIGYLKEQKKVYADLDEDGQRAVISNLDEAFALLINDAVSIIAARGFRAVHGTLESLTIKGEVKAAVKLLRDVATVADLGSKTGSTVMIVLAEPREFFGGSIPKPDPQSPPLLPPDEPEEEGR